MKSLNEIKMLYKGHLSLRSVMCFYLLLVVVCSLGQSARADVNAVSRASFPVPFRVDMNGYIKSSMYLSADRISYGKSFDTFCQTKSSPTEQAFQIIASAASMGDFSEISSFLPATYIESKEADRKWIADSYRNMLNNPDYGGSLDRMQVLEQVYLGNDRVFIWEMPASQEKEFPRLVRPCILKGDKQGNFLWEPIGVDKIVTLVTYSVEQFGSPPATDKRQDEKQFEFKHLLMGDEPGHPVYLKFNGEKYNIDILNSEIEKSDEVAVFYQKACSAFMEKGPLAHADFYTKRSREKYSNWIMDMTEDRKNAYTTDTIKGGRIVSFIIQADPVYVVFYENSGTGQTGLDYIIRDPIDSELKLTNFYMQTYFHDLIINITSDVCNN